MGMVRLDNSTVSPHRDGTNRGVRLSIGWWLAILPNKLNSFFTFGSQRVHTMRRAEAAALCADGNIAMAMSGSIRRIVEIPSTSSN
jgi:hypothetical protein